MLNLEIEDTIHKMDLRATFIFNLCENSRFLKIQVELNCVE